MQFWNTWRQILRSIRSNEVRQITIVEPWWYPGIAIITGLLAAISGIIYVRTASLGNEAVYYSNQAVLAQSQASDNWNEYEADSGKAKTVEMTLLLVTDPATRVELKKQQDDYRHRQLPLKSQAKQFESVRDDFVLKTNKKVHDRDGLSITGVVIQLGIGLASVAAMTKRNYVFVMTIIVTMTGLTMTCYAFFHLLFH